MRATEIDVQALLAAYDSGLSVDALRHRFGIGYDRTRRLLVNNGRTLRQSSYRGLETEKRRAAYLKALYESLVELAASHATLPPVHQLSKRFGCDIRCALTRLSEQGLIRYEAKRAVETSVTIVATGITIRTRRRFGGAHLKTLAAQRFDRSLWGKTGKKTPSVWGDLTRDVEYLRTQGDIISHAGTRREPKAKINGVIVTLDEIAARASRIREREMRRASAAATYAAVY